MSQPFQLFRIPITPPRSPDLKMLHSNKSPIMPSIGDVLMLSQTAWRTGRAFASGKKCSEKVPQEFIDVELELAHLSKALKSLAEVLTMDNVESFIASSEDLSPQDGITAILQSCKKTLEDLESMTSLYQTNRKQRTAGGFTIERLWNDSLLNNYDTYVWTADGGNIHDLYEFLRMHTVTVSMLKSTLERSSFPGLEIGIPAIAEKIAELHTCSPVDLSAHLAEIRGFAQAVGFDLPSPALTEPPTPTLSLHRSSTNTVINVNQMSPPMQMTPEPDSIVSTKPFSSQSQIAHFLKKELPSVPVIHYDDLPPRSDSLSPRSMPHTPEDSPTPTPGPLNDSHPILRTVTSNLELPQATAGAESMRRPGHRKSLSACETILLPPAAWDSSHRSSKQVEQITEPKIAEPDSYARLSQGTSVQQEEFERRQFRNAVILCDVRGVLVEYVNRHYEEGLRSDSNGDTDVEEVMTHGRICLVREKKTFRTGEIVYTLGIWAFSDDLTVRFQQTLDESAEIIPFTSYFQPNKVSITIPTTVHHHSIVPGLRPLKSVETRWVNYYFATESGSREFQNQIFGRSLIACYKTEKTMRLHDGLAGIVSSHEQMCGMENLRVWYEEETGGYLVLIHYSALFRKGYMKFYLNNVNVPIHIKEDGHRNVRVKGLRIPGPAFSFRGGPREPHLGGKKFITGVKVEFTTEADKLAFVQIVREAQVGMVDIEEMGVS